VINARLVFLVEKPDGQGEKNNNVFASGSPRLNALVMLRSTRRRQLEQSKAWVAVNDFPCFPKASCVVDALHGWEMVANDALRSLHHPLEGLPYHSHVNV